VKENEHQLRDEGETLSALSHEAVHGNDREKGYVRDFFLPDRGVCSTTPGLGETMV
jgi:hypothetical protein